jgi:hypothetical protein
MHQSLLHWRLVRLRVIVSLGSQGFRHVVPTTATWLINCMILGLCWHHFVRVKGLVWCFIVIMGNLHKSTMLSGSDFRFQCTADVLNEGRSGWSTCVNLVSQLVCVSIGRGSSLSPITTILSIQIVKRPFYTLQMNYFVMCAAPDF